MFMDLALALTVHESFSLSPPNTDITIGALSLLLAVQVFTEHLVYAHNCSNPHWKK